MKNLNSSAILCASTPSRPAPRLYSYTLLQLHCYIMMAGLEKTSRFAIVRANTVCAHTVHACRHRQMTTSMKLLGNTSSSRSCSFFLEKFSVSPSPLPHTQSIHLRVLISQWVCLVAVSVIKEEIFSVLSFLFWFGFLPADTYKSSGTS